MSKIITISSSSPSLQTFRQYCGQITDRSAPVVRNITAVGAVVEGGELSLRDQYWLAHAMIFCASGGINVDPDFRYTPVDCRNGHDILNPDLSLPRTDLMVVGFILDPTKEAYALAKLFEDDPNFLTSPRSTPTAWQETVQRLNPHAVVAFSGLPPYDEMEISCRSFKRPKGYAYVGTSVVGAPEFAVEGSLQGYGCDALIRQPLKVASQTPTLSFR